VGGGLGSTDTFVLLPVLLLTFARTVVGGMTFGTAFEGLREICLVRIHGCNTTDIKRTKEEFLVGGGIFNPCRWASHTEERIYDGGELTYGMLHSLAEGNSTPF
jgi:hypothetical protein